MNYKEKLESAKTLSQLIDFREELLSEEEKFSSSVESELNLDNLRKCQNANFWLAIVNDRIKSLFKCGVRLESSCLKPEIQAGFEAIELLRKIDKYISVPTNSIGFNGQFEIEIKAILSKAPVIDEVSA